jgi:hypothetical protein
MKHEKIIEISFKHQKAKPKEPKIKMNKLNNKIKINI